MQEEIINLLTKEAMTMYKLRRALNAPIGSHRQKQLKEAINALLLNGKIARQHWGYDLTYTYYLHEVDHLNLNETEMTDKQIMRLRYLKGRNYSSLKTKEIKELALLESMQNERVVTNLYKNGKITDQEARDAMLRLGLDHAAVSRMMEQLKLSKKLGRKQDRTQRGISSGKRSFRPGLGKKVTAKIEPVLKNDKKKK
jgi:hypothetical protein